MEFQDTAGFTPQGVSRYSWLHSSGSLKIQLVLLLVGEVHNITGFTPPRYSKYSWQQKSGRYKLNLASLTGEVQNMHSCLHSSGGSSKYSWLYISRDSPIHTL
jgi:hypothetical protein